MESTGRDERLGQRVRQLVRAGKRAREERLWDGSNDV